MKQAFEGHIASVNAVAVTPDGKHIISGSSDKTLRLWELNTKECLRVFKGHKSAIKAAIAAGKPGNECCISASRDKTLRLWDLNTGKCLKVFKGHNDEVNAIALTADGKGIVSGSSDCTLRLWELSTGKCIRVFASHPACRDMDGINRLIRSSNYEFTYHDFLTNLAYSVTYDRETASFFGHADHVDAVAVTKNGKYVVSGSSDNTLRLWNLHTGKCLWIFGGHKGGPGGWVRAAAVSPSGKTAISGSSTIQLWKISNKTLRRHLWGIIGEKCLCRFDNHEEGVNAIAVIPKGGKIIVASGWKPNLHIYKLRTGKCLQTFAAHEKEINDVAVTPDCRFALSASSDGTVKLWDLKEKENN